MTLCVLCAKCSRSICKADDGNGDESRGVVRRIEERSGFHQELKG